MLSEAKHLKNYRVFHSIHGLHSRMLRFAQHDTCSLDKVVVTKDTKHKVRIQNKLICSPSGSNRNERRCQGETPCCRIASRWVSVG